MIDSGAASMDNNSSREYAPVSGFAVGIYKNPAPRIMHVEIVREMDSDSRLIIIGDVHGCLAELKLLLTQCDYRSERDTLVFVGDLVNKGPFSAEVVKFVRSIGAVCVRGNHDDTAIFHALQANVHDVNPPERYQYLKELDRDDLEWLIDLPYTISVPHFDALIVHAGVVPGVALNDQSSIDMYLIRKLVNDSGKDVPWASLWKGGPHVYFGHDAKRGMQLHDHATGLDTGCCYGRKLTAIILPKREFVQVDALMIYEIPKTS